jgi:drug/metabolite transporter (DMT)-like permease
MLKAYSYISVSQICLGISIAISVSAMTEIPVGLFAVITFAIAACLTFPAAKMKEQVKFAKLGRANHIGVFFQALFSGFLLTVFNLFGVKYTSAMAAGIITSTVPAVTLILAFIFLHERIKLRQIAGIAFAVVGIAIINIMMSGDGGAGSLLGNALIFGGVLSVSTFFICAKKFSAIVPPISMTFVLNVWGVIFFLPMALWELPSFDWASVSSGNWWICFFYSLTSCLFSYLFTFIGMPKVPASVFGLFNSFVPVTTTLIAVLFLGETFTLFHALALLCVLVSIILAVDKQKEEVIPEATEIISP